MSMSIDSERIFSDEYEIQHFGVSCTELLFKLQQLLTSKIEEKHKQIEQSSIKHLKLDDEKVNILHEEITKLTKLHNEKIAEAFKMNEGKVRELFSIPQHILLKEDEIADNVNTVKTEELLNEIETLEQEILKEKTLQALYDQELEEISQIEKDQEIYKTIEQVSELSKITQNLKDLDSFQIQCNKRFDELQISDKPIKLRMNKHMLKCVATTEPKPLI